MTVITEGKSFKSYAYLIFLCLSVLINFIIYPQLMVLHIFSLVYIGIIYYKFSTDFSKLITCSLILFGTIGSNMYFYIKSSCIYYYFVLIFIYYINFVYTIIKNKQIHNMIKKAKNTYFIVFFIICLYTVVSVFTSSNVSVAISSVKNNIIMLSLVFIIAIEFTNKNNVKEYAKFFMWLIIGVLVLGTIEIIGIRYGLKNTFVYLQVPVAQFPHIKHVPVVFFYNPNNYSLFLVLSMIVILYKIFYPRNNKENYIYYLIYIIALINLIFAMSRTAWISLNMTLGFIVVFYVINREWRCTINATKVFILTLIIMFGLSHVNFMKPYYGKMQKITNIEIGGENNNINNDEANVLKVGNSGSTNIRYTLLFDVAKGVFKDKNYFGFGPGNTSLYIKSLNNTHKIHSIHSFWFEILGDYGVFIFTLVIVFYLLVCWNILYKYRNEKGYIKNASCIFGFLMFAIVFVVFGPSSVINLPIFNLIFGACIGFSFKYKGKVI
ncbi:O-antigen ligase family protein [Hathewaya histolytica]|uniref:O-antigen ligase family protein n=1 Tax=Hathewaya histolytica TaxID=1498 RepID=UPI003B680AD1